MTANENALNWFEIPATDITRAKKSMEKYPAPWSKVRITNQVLMESGFTSMATQIFLWPWRK